MSTDKGPSKPVELHAALGAIHPLSWGDPVPSRAEIERQYGLRATTASLAMVQSRLATEQQSTATFVSAVPANCGAYQLECRVKSPQSLARKLAGRIDRGQQLYAPDLLRYTVVTERHDDLVEATRATVNALLERGWTVVSAHHSYLEGNRYKGIHAQLADHAGHPVEVQVHSKDSVRVKERTTRLYSLERDGAVPDRVRAAAREECVRLSGSLRSPSGMENLTELGGCPVEQRVIIDTTEDRGGRSPEASLGERHGNEHQLNEKGGLER